VHDDGSQRIAAGGDQDILARIEVCPYAPPEKGQGRAAVSARLPPTARARVHIHPADEVVPGIPGALALPDQDLFVLNNYMNLL
jgi:hypothetical protein